MKFHKISELFPLLPESELGSLANDIKLNGLKFPICLFDGKILDGRNRFTACGIAGVKPEFETYDGPNPLGHVISLNLKRRHMNESQRAMVAAKLANMPSHRPANKSANLPTSEIDQPTAAKLLNVSERSLRTARAIIRDTPAEVAHVENGTKTLNEVERETRRASVVANLESIQVKQAKAVSGVYDVVVIDPPWPMKKIERDCSKQPSELDYPTMDEAAISAVKIPASKDCHLWLWTTHRFLPMAFRILDAWKFTYVCLFVWHKPGGFQPFGLPQYNSEFALYARQGSPTFVDTKAFPVCFNAGRGAHSEKPEEFYATVRRVTAGRRLDMFNRREIEGFDRWGNEV